jgi:predicted dehydrogenase
MTEKSMEKMNGINYAPISQGKIEVVCQEGDFLFSVIGLDHGHIYAMCNGLLEVGAMIRQVYDPDPNKIIEFLKKYPAAIPVESPTEILADAKIHLIASAIRPDLRAELGIRVMKAGKDFFVDKPGMLSLAEIDTVALCCKKTKQKYLIYFGERIHVEGAIFAEELIQKGTIGTVLQVTILAPHRLNKEIRPSWFFEKSKNGGIITDIGSHQIEQFLSFCQAKTAHILHSYVTNYENKDKPEFYDYGECNLLADTGALCYFRVDWFTPAGLGAWGDGRVFILGTKGSIEIRKYINVAQDRRGDHVYWIDETGEYYEQVSGKLGFVFFGKLILDCLQRTEYAATQQHILESMRITVRAQEYAEKNSDCNLSFKPPS